MKTDWKSIVISGFIFSIIGSIIAILLDYFWSDISLETNILTKNTLFRLLLFFVLGMFLKYRQLNKQPKKQ
jgi:uncharacterized membrane protein YagU involved in acid resistance